MSEILYSSLMMDDKRLRGFILSAPKRVISESEEIDLKMVAKGLNAILDKLDALAQNVNTVNSRIDALQSKVDTLASTVSRMEERIVQKNEREINRAIRRFAMKSNTDRPIGFVPNHSIPLSSLLHSKEL